MAMSDLSNPQAVGRDCTPQEPISVVIANPNKLYAAGVEETLALATQGNARPVQVVGVADSFRGLLGMLSKLRPAVLVLDEEIIDRCPEHLDAIQMASASTYLIIMVECLKPGQPGRKNYTLNLISWGARSVVPREAPVQILVEYIASVAKGRYAIPTAVVGWMAQRLMSCRNGFEKPPLPSFTETETRIIRLLMDGKKNSQIADECSTSEQTIKNRLSRIYGRVGVDGREKMRAFVVSSGILSGAEVKAEHQA